MAKERNDNFKYEIDKDFDFIIEEGSNTSINVRKISWNDRPFKLDIRKYSYKDGEENMMKGVSLKEESASTLAEVLVDNGYGDTRKLIKSLRDRDGFDESLLDKSIEIVDDSEEEYYDPKELLYSSSESEEE